MISGTIRIFIFIVLLGGFISCKKYPDGPLINVEPKFLRIKSTWTLEKLYINSVDKTDSLTQNEVTRQLVIELNNHRYTFEGATSHQQDYDEEGKWEWKDHKKYIHLKHGGNGHAGLYGFPSVQPYDAREYDCRILRLKEKELWLKETQVNGDVWEMHFISVAKTI